MAFVEFVSKGTHTLNYTFGSSKIEDGMSYVMHESWVGQVPGAISLLDDQFRRYNINEDANGKSILFMRTMGGGDMLFLSALIHYIKEKYPDAKISFACIKEQSDIPNLMSGVEKVYPFPLPAHIFHSFDYHFDVAGLLEGEGANADRNAYDVYFEHLGIPTDENGIAMIDASYKRPKIDKSKFGGVAKNNKLIGLHPFAHDPIRQFDPYVTNKLCQALINAGYEVVMFGSQQERQVHEFLFPGVRWVSGDSITQSCLVAASCQALIGCDSMMVHLAQALGVHTLAIYGPFDPSTRIKYYENIDIIDTTPNCRCKLHRVGQCPKGFRNSPCMNVEPEFIVKFLEGNFDHKYPGELSVNVMAYNIRIVEKDIPEGAENVSQG